ncbi:MAG TPA: signal peptidase I [Anaerolineae bacterium]
MRVVARAALVRQRWMEIAITAPAYGWMRVLVWLLVVYFIVNFITPHLPSGDVQLYLVEPLVWLLFTGFVIFQWRADIRSTPWTISRFVVLTALLAGLSQFVIFQGAGMLAGFGRSPFSHKFPIVALNLWFVATHLVGQEFARAYLVSAIGKHYPGRGISMTWLVFFFIGLPLGIFSQFDTVDSALPVIGRELLPGLSSNLLATYLAYLGGPFASIAYLGTLDGFKWLLPILPDLPFMLEAFIGTISPVAGMLLTNSLTTVQPVDVNPETFSKKSSSGVNWVLAGVFAVVLVWFNTGMFGVRPALMVGISMEPTFYAGDIVITRTVTPGEIAVDDVVRFRGPNDSIMHRVIGITHLQGKKVFITQGDNNNTIDDPWDEGRLEGKAIVVIPKIGLVGLAVRSGLNWMGLR